MVDTNSHPEANSLDTTKPKRCSGHNLKDLEQLGLDKDRTILSITNPDIGIPTEFKSFDKGLHKTVWEEIVDKDLATIYRSGRTIQAIEGAKKLLSAKADYIVKFSYKKRMYWLDSIPHQ